MSGFLSLKEVAKNVVEISKNKSELQILPMLLLGINTPRELESPRIGSLR